MNHVKADRHHCLLPLLLAASLLGGCQDSQPEAQANKQLPTVLTETLVKRPHYQQQLEYSGTVRAANTTGVGFELAGKLNSIHADSGDKVSKGQLLATLDTSLLNAEQRELEAAMAQNAADLRLAQSTLKRSMALKKQGYASSQEFDEQQGKLNSLEGAREQLQASLDATRLRLEKSRLLAPFDGVISQRNFNLGEVLPLGQSVFTVVENRTPQAHIGVPAEVARALNVGNNVQLQAGKQQLTATIAGINPAIDPLTRTVGLRLSLPAEANVLNGELVILHHELTVEKPGFWVPISALTDGLRGLWNLYVLASRDGSFVIERRDVEIVYTHQDQAFLVGALNDGEQIVVQGLHKLVPGERVQPVTQKEAN